MALVATLFLSACSESTPTTGKNLNSSSAKQKNNSAVNYSSNSSALLNPVSAISLSASYKYSGSAATTAVLDSISAKASLRAKLPLDTMVYIRMPSLWGFLSTPKGTALDKALRDSAHAEVIKKLQAALFEKILNNDTYGAHKMATFLLYNMRAPLELAVLPSDKNSAGPIPYLVIYTKTNFKTVKEASDAFAALAATTPPFKIESPMNDSGRAIIKLGNRVPGFIDYSVKTGELYIGIGYTAANADAALAQFKPSKHVMHELELKVDESAQGLLLWVDIDKLLIQLKPVIPPRAYRQLGLIQLRKAAIGWGVYKGKSRMKIVADLPWDLPAYTSVMGKEIKLNASGQPTYFMAMALPGPEHWNIYKTLLAGMPNSSQRRIFDSVNAAFTKSTGLVIDDLFKTLGPQIMFFGDKVGYYAALKLRDVAKFEAMIKTLVSTAKLDYKTYTQKGKTIHYLIAPQVKPDPILRRALPAAALLIFRQKMHLYWTIEGDYIVLAAIPQMLRDRASFPNKVEIGAWLKLSQNQDFENAAWIASFTTTGVSRLMYYTYLNWLQILGDIIGQPVEIAQLPSIQELAMPEKGTYGFQVNLYKNRFSTELVFENNPWEFLFDAKVIVVAGTVAVAAVAFVEYQQQVQAQNNVARSNVGKAVYRSVQIQSKVAAYYRSNKKYPDSTASAGMVTGMNRGSSGNVFKVQSGTGKITIRFRGNLKLWGRTINLTPEVNAQGMMSWKCTSNVAYNYVPHQCKN